MGYSVDWKRQRFTLDEGLSEAVKEAFVRLHEQGLISVPYTGGNQQAALYREKQAVMYIGRSQPRYVYREKTSAPTRIQEEASSLPYTGGSQLTAVYRGEE